MREFLWGYFCRTGVIDAYLLYKEHEAPAERGSLKPALPGHDKRAPGTGNAGVGAD